MYRIQKEFHFSASHQLSGLDANHPCSRLHGHNYVISIILRASMLNGVGFVKDYRELDNIKKWIDDNLDHHHLNDRVDFNPTAELLAEFLYAQFHQLLHLGAQPLPMTVDLESVVVAETEKTWAEYSQ